MKVLQGVKVPSSIIGLLLILLCVLLFAGCGNGGSEGSGDSGMVSPDPPVVVEPSDPPAVVKTPVLASPVRADLTSDGDVVVTDFSAGYVFFLDPSTLKTTKSFPAPSQLSGIAVADDKIFVGMEASGAVGAYDFNGQLLFKLGSGNGEFIKPNDMFADVVDSRIYVVDTGAKVVKVYNFDGTPIQTDFGIGQLNFPTGIAMDPSDNTILVSDFAVELGGSFSSHVAGIWRFNLSGGVVEKIKGSFSRPQGLAVENNKIFLVDSLLGQVLVLEKDSGTSAYLEVTRYGGTDPGERHLRLPLDTVIDPESKSLFVTNNALGKVELFVEGGDI